MEILMVIFYSLMILLWIGVLVDLIVNAKKLPLKPTYRYVLIMIPFIGPIIYFATKKKAGELNTPAFKIKKND